MKTFLTLKRWEWDFVLKTHLTEGSYTVVDGSYLKPAKGFKIPDVDEGADFIITDDNRLAYFFEICKNPSPLIDYFSSYASPLKEEVYDIATVKYREWEEDYKEILRLENVTLKELLTAYRESFKKTVYF